MSEERRKLTAIIAILALSASVSVSGITAFAADTADTAAETTETTETTDTADAAETTDALATAAPDGDLETPPDGDMGTPPDGDGQTPPAKPDEQLPFEDVAEDSWYYSVVSRVYGMGLITGVSDTEFAPEDKVTGAQLLTMLARADGEEVNSEETEESEGNWYDAAVEWAKTNSIIYDEDNGWEFEPDSPLTREQMMVILYRYEVYKGETMTAADLSSYTDSDSLSEYAADAAACLVGAGLIEGDGDTLRPLDSLSRAETAAILSRSVQASDMPSGDKPDGEKPNDKPGGGFGNVSFTQGNSALTITEDGEYASEIYLSQSDDENALRVDNATVTFNNITVDKSDGASSNTESGDFYGVNAAVLATNGANVTIKDSTISSSAQNGNGVFSYGEGTVVNISDSVITTTSDNSGGIQTTGGGTTNAKNLTITTSGSSAAAIRSDRGGGTVNVSGGTYTSNGYNSPAIYSTAAISVSDAVLTANNSEALVIEGKNSISLTDCTVSGNMSDTKGSSSDENVHNVMIYQSMSGDADVGTSEFDMTGGTLTSNNGDVIYTTNTHCIIKLTDVDISNLDPDSYFMRVSGNSGTRGWGTAGANGSQAEVTLSKQTLDGDIVVDTVSQLDLSLESGTNFIGTVNIIENEEGGDAVADNAVITIDSDSTWTLTGDCTVTSLTNNGTINYNGHKITLADGTVLSE